MEVNIYAVFDLKAKAYLSPFSAATDGLAVRQVQDLVRQPNSIFNAHCEDFTLYRVGQFLDHTGQLVAQNEPAFIVSLLALKEEGSDQRQIDLVDVSAGGSA